MFSNITTGYKILEKYAKDTIEEATKSIQSFLHQVQPCTASYNSIASHQQHTKLPPQESKRAFGKIALCCGT